MFSLRMGYICLNRCTYGSLTANVSLRSFSFTLKCPPMSRVTPAIALTFTSVERWICQKICGSSSSISSLIGRRISDSCCGVTTSVYLLSAWK